MMRVVRAHKKAVTRQVHEATLIDCSKAHVIMNSKSEYNGSRIPRIRMEVGATVLTRDYQGLGLPPALEQEDETMERAEEDSVLEWERTRNERCAATLKVLETGPGSKDSSVQQVEKGPTDTEAQDSRRGKIRARAASTVRDNTRGRRTENRDSTPGRGIQQRQGQGQEPCMKDSRKKGAGGTQG